MSIENPNLFRDKSHSIFGEFITAELTPILQYDFVYGEPENWETLSATGGSVTFSDNMTVCQTGLSVGGYGVSRTQRSQIYRPGEANVFRFTAAFDSANANALSRQSAGPFNLTDAMAFGYNGTEFGVLYEHNGHAEIQVLTVSAGASGNETLTITIAGTEYTVPVTSGSADYNSHEIEQSLIAQVSGWRFDHIDNTVVCQCEAASAQTNDFTLVNETGGGTCAGSFTQTIAGQATTKDWYNQSEWKGENLGFDFDPSKINIYEIDFGYLGSAGIRYWIMNPHTLEFRLAHFQSLSNALTKPIFFSPSMRVGWVAASLGSSGKNITVKGASLLAAVVGKRERINTSKTVETQQTGLSNSEVSVLSLRNKMVFYDKPNQGVIEPLSVSVSTDSTKGGVFSIYKNATVSGNTGHTEYSSSSIGMTDITNGSVSGGNLIRSKSLGKAGEITFDLQDDNIELLLRDELTITYTSNASGSPSDQVNVAVTWREDK